MSLFSVTSNFDDDSIEIDKASVETSLSHYMYVVYFSDTQRQATPQYKVWKIKHIQYFMHVFVTCKLKKKDQINSNRGKVETLNFRRSRVAKSSDPIWPNFELMEDIRGAIDKFAELLYY